MEENFTFNLSNLKIDQLGYVYKDLKKQAKIMESLYNIPKFAILEGPPEKIVYRGKESILNYNIGLSRFFNVQLELIQWNDGECIYKEFLEQGREGLHHISMFIENLDAYIEEFKKMGIDVIESGQIGKVVYAYMDTEESFGIIIEIQETMRRRKRRK